MKIYLKFSLILIILLGAIFSALNVRAVISNIPGWIIFSHSKPNQKSLECAAYSKLEWQVEWKERNIQIHSSSKKDLEKFLPFKISDDTKISLVNVSSFLKTKTGWLVGYDGGEWGGKLWWVDNKGNRKLLLEENVVEIVESSQGSLVFTGLSHLRTNYGKVYLVEDKSNDQVSVRLLSELGEKPSAIVQESKDSWYVLTDDKLLKFNISGKGEDVINLSLSYPNSMIQTPDGIIYIGSRLFVVRLTPKEKGFNEEWLVPESCKSFKLKDYHCECTGNHEKI